MPSTTVRIPPEGYKLRRRLAEREGKTLQETLVEALEELKRRRFFAALDDRVAALQRDPEGWKAELEERRAWDATIADDLDDDETPRAKPKNPRKSRRNR